MAMASVISPNPTTQLTMTSKEWVIPPRPKPGRKPATDTPPTKRKAQNRAAQRAFRERRAARVGELEEQLEEIREEHERKERESQERIHQLEVESQALQAKCQWLESTLEKERLERARTSSIPSTPTQHNGNNNLSRLASRQPPQDTGRRSLPTSSSASIVGPRPIPQPFSISQIISPLDQIDDTTDLTCGSCEPNGRCACAEEVMSKATLGCGKCALGTTCTCLDESLESTGGAPDLKRPHPPASPSSMSHEEKRQRPADVESPLETDFTAMFSQKKLTRPGSPYAQPQPQHRQRVTIDPKDQCGFCKDGTYCVCADSMPLTADNAEAALSLPTPQSTSHQTQTPPPEDVGPIPMEITSTGAIKLPSFQSLSQGRNPRGLATAAPPARGRTCGPGGPGTCAQCLSDPKSGLFCRSLAANFERTRPAWSQLRPIAGADGGCCGSGGPGGCCKLDPNRAGQEKPAAGRGTTDRKDVRRVGASGLGLSLSCADAYKTLSSHRHFGEAANDIGEWLPKLRAAPTPRAHAGVRGSVEGLAPIEVEAASIMSVLKGFDVRFGH